MEEKSKKSISIDTNVAKKIEELGKRESRNFSNMVNKILIDYIKQVDAEENSYLMEK